MAEELQGLLERINKEGLEKTEQAKQTILDEAKAEAAKIVSDAEAKAKSTISSADEEATKLQAKGEAALKQASRDVILSLQKEIESVLTEVTAKSVKSAMDAGTLESVVESMVNGFVANGLKPAGVEVLLNAADCEKLEKAVAGKFKETLSEGLTLKPVNGIDSGIEIGLTGSDAKFDITGETVTEMICAYVSPKLVSLIKEN